MYKIGTISILEWNTRNVTKMNGMFYECISLEKLPNLTKWDISNVTDISYMFYECKSLKKISFGHNSIWKCLSLNKINNIFYGCSKLLSIPDI